MVRTTCWSKKGRFFFQLTPQWFVFQHTVVFIHLGLESLLYGIRYTEQILPPELAGASVMAFSPFLHWPKPLTVLAISNHFAALFSSSGPPFSTLKDAQKSYRMKPNQEILGKQKNASWILQPGGPLSAPVPAPSAPLSSRGLSELQAFVEVKGRWHGGDGHLFISSLSNPQGHLCLCMHYRTRVR